MTTVYLSTKVLRFVEIDTIKLVKINKADSGVYFAASN